MIQARQKEGLSSHSGERYLCVAGINLEQGRLFGVVASLCDVSQ